MVERGRTVVYDVLEEVIAEHPVLLNRAPTLHRLGIQAFEPQLVEGKAIQIHPLVCTAFNADFDGDQMAVHLPLSAEAQAEARILMLSSNNILKPADGRPVTMPTQDMVLGLFFLTTDEEERKVIGEGRSFGSTAEAIMAFDARRALAPGEDRHPLPDRHRPAARLDPAGSRRRASPEWQQGDSFRLRTTLGRALFNELLPEDYPFVDYSVGKKQLSEIVNDLAERYPKVIVAATLDNLKAAGFYWATRSGVTVAISDVVVPEAKKAIVAGYEAQDEKVQKQYERGLITKDERTQELIAIWTKATNEVAEAMNANFPKTNPIFMMVDSGARGNMMQMRQIAGMRGLVSNAKNETIPRPIKASFREGLSVLEYFISTHGARKGLADTALRTADSGYLTRRLVDVSQDVIIREEDCGTERGLKLRIADDAAPTACCARRRTSRPACTRACSPRTSSSTARSSRRPTSTSATCSSTQLVAARRRGGQDPLGPDLRVRGRHLRHAATAVRWPPASWSTSVRRSASSPPSPSVSPVPS